MTDDGGNDSRYARKRLQPFTENEGSARTRHGNEQVELDGIEQGNTTLKGHDTAREGDTNKELAETATLTEIRIEIGNAKDVVTDSVTGRRRGRKNRFDDPVRAESRTKASIDLASGRLFADHERARARATN
ncbi:hypothetical protein EVAR_98390_1 [Eumeta japonica]|uniref:Uncharacterized protein n=1 Tax=Eumeta variegata TaxID=151549 RepID=A0A4C1XU10_EUMVA|nr:hypothetical protein EVAR_98390_1 [Eumeta japonica]